MDWNGLLDAMTATVRDTFGEPVSYVRSDGQAVEITGVYDPDYKPVEVGGTMQTLSNRIVLDVREADIGLPATTDDTLRVKGRRFRVMAIWPSSSGMVKLELRRA